MFLLLALIFPLLALLGVALALRNRRIVSPGNYAFALATSLALAYLGATSVVSSLPVLAILGGSIGTFSETALELYAYLLASNAVVAFLLFAAKRGFSLGRPSRQFAFYAALFTFLVFFRITCYWAFYQFPLQDPNMVFGVVKSPLGDTPARFLAIWAKSAMLPALVISAVLVPALLFLWTSKAWAPKLVPAGTLVLFAATVYGISGNVPLFDYYEQTKDYDSEFSPFYKAHYVFPDSVKITAPAQKPNLLFIFLESMEVSFQDSASGGLHSQNFMPEITGLAKENLNFSGGQPVGGGADLVGTGWTVAGTVAKFMGVPVLSAMDEGRTFARATGLTDILAREGYNQSYVIGSAATFEGRDKIFQKHGNVTIKDLAYFKKLGRIPEDYFVFWGFEDSRLYGFVKEELDSLSRRPEPFALFTLTTSTHIPKGFYEREACPEFAPKNDTYEENLKAAIRCSSRQLGDFIAWAKAQEWFKTTTVVIVGDHIWPQKLLIPKDHLVNAKNAGSLRNGDAQNDPYRRWVCIYMNPANEPATRFRHFSSFDIFPTTLEAMGFEVGGHALGFGRSLFSSEPTLVESLGEAEINRNFTKRTPEYLYLMGDPNGEW